MTSTTGTADYVAIGTELFGSKGMRTILCKKTYMWSDDLETTVHVPGTYQDFIKKVRAVWTIQQPVDSLMLTTNTAAVFMNDLEEEHVKKCKAAPLPACYNFTISSEIE